MIFCMCMVGEAQGQERPENNISLIRAGLDVVRGSMEGGGLICDLFMCGMWWSGMGFRYQLSQIVIFFSPPGSRGSYMRIWVINCILPLLTTPRPMVRVIG